MNSLFCNIISFLLSIVFACLISACSNSNDANYAEITTNSEEYWNTKVDYLPLDDTEYPYADIPRIVIETVNHLEIRDRETEIPAKLQIWGENAPESEVMNLTIRGRGYSSWLYMPKKSYKIKFVDKYSPLGMPENKEWALISNYADKSLLKNTISYGLSESLKMDYTPQNTFAELYLNKEYMGLYLLVETVKISKTRINVPSGTYLVEFDNHNRSKDQTITTASGTPFTIHAPQNASTEELKVLKDHLDSIEDLFSRETVTDSIISHLFDIESYIKYYWVQEFSKNKDGAFLSSVYFTWIPNGKIKMGPLWDFDGAYGVNPYLNAKPSSGWLIRNYYWNTKLFKNELFRKQIKDFWNDHKKQFYSVIDSIDSNSAYISKAVKNNFKRWPILGQTSDVLHQHPYSSYKEVLDTLKNWIRARNNWINSSFEKQ